MCKTNVKTNIYYINICKHEHEKNMTRLWCKIVLETGVEQTKGNDKGCTFIIPLWEPNSKKLPKRFLCVH
jgi:hypothetical protein